MSKMTKWLAVYGVVAITVLYTVRYLPIVVGILLGCYIFKSTKKGK